MVIQKEDIGRILDNIERPMWDGYIPVHIDENLFGDNPKIWVEFDDDCAADIEITDKIVLIDIEEKCVHQGIDAVLNFIKESSIFEFQQILSEEDLGEIKCFFRKYFGRDF